VTVTVPGPAAGRTAAGGVAGIAFDDPDLEASVRAGLALVERRLREVVSSDHPLVSEAARHLVDAGGKRIRPLLVLLGAHLGEPAAAGVVDAAVVVELTHLASLYHDDVMDEAPVRRGAPAAHQRWTNTVAILTGDYLFARASDLVAGLGPEAVRIQARTFSRLVTGQIDETVGARNGATDLDHHLHVLAEKTGSLIATSGRFGAMFGGSPKPAVEAMARYGEALGVCFQLADDILDIASDSVESGKTPGTDLREGVRTLPVLFALAGTDPGERRLRELLGRPLSDGTEHAEALRLLRRSPAMDRARSTLRSYAQRAIAALADVPEGPPRSALASLVDFVAERRA
jgi:heptaprenyl diphosphate synthase